MKKIKNWWIAHREDIEFAYFMTLFAAGIYATIWVINWLFITFLKFTGLKYIVLAWIGWCTGWAIQSYIEERKSK
jgi:hypothetical protein